MHALLFLEFFPTIVSIFCVINEKICTIISFFMKDMKKKESIHACLFQSARLFGSSERAGLTWKKTRKEKLSQTILKIYTIFMRNQGDALSVLLVFCLVINQIKISSAGPTLTCLCRHRCVALMGTFKSYMDKVSTKVCNGSMAYGHQHITNFGSQEHENSNPKLFE